MIAGTLKGVISQRLVRSVDGGRIAVCEILRMTGRVHDMIKDPEQISKLRDVIFSGGYYGMQTFDQALFKHVKAGLVSFEDAMRVATSPHDFKLLVEADGKRGTTMADVEQANRQRPPLPPRGAPLPGGVTPGVGSGGLPGQGAPGAGLSHSVSPGAGLSGGVGGVAANPGTAVGSGSVANPVPPAGLSHGVNPAFSRPSGNGS